MANRYTTKTHESMEKSVKIIYCKVQFGASGAPTLVTAPKYDSKGIASVTRVSAGKYTFVFGVLQNGALQKDVYFKRLGLGVSFDTTGTGAAPASPGIYVTNDSTSVAGTSSLTVQLNSAGTATDPASGEIALFSFSFGDSSTP